MVVSHKPWQIGIMRSVAPAAGYPYSNLATDRATNQTVAAFYRLIYHTAVAAQIGQGG